MNEDTKGENELNFFNEEGIDIKEIYLMILRNKKLILRVTILGLLLGVFYSITAKKVWEGEFQIVLEETRKQSGIKLPLQGIEQFTKANDELQTQVGILKSPLVLKKVFEFVKEEKFKKNNQKSIMKFNKWKKNSLNIYLEKGTSILNISYRDNHKDLILPVLTKISNSYQNYSGRKRLREIELSKNFFKNQIELFKVKSQKSIRIAQNYANEQDIAILFGNSTIDNEIQNSINIEAIRVNSANEIRNLNINFDRLSQMVDPESIVHFGRSIPGLDDMNLLNQIDQTEKELVFAKYNYTPKDKKILELERSRKILIKLFKEKALGDLEAQRISAQARLEASERPEGVLIKYRQLIGEASRDKRTLENLQNQYRGVLLEEARTTDPWELITSPTLSPNYVSPKDKRIALFSLFAGFLISLIISTLIEKKNNIIYSAKNMYSIVNWKILYQLSMKESESFIRKLKYILDSNLFDKKEIVEILIVGDFDTKSISILKNTIDSFQSKKFKLLKSVFDLNEDSPLIVVTGLGITKKDLFIQTVNNLLVQQKNVIGNLVIEDCNFEI